MAPGNEAQLPRFGLVGLLTKYQSGHLEADCEEMYIVEFKGSENTSLICR